MTDGEEIAVGIGIGDVSELLVRTEEAVSEAMTLLKQQGIDIRSLDLYAIDVHEALELLRDIHADYFQKG